MSSEIEKAYRYCESVTRNHARSFYFAARFLPKKKQKAVYPIYAFCRHVDDEIDEMNAGDQQCALAALDAWRTDLEFIYRENKRRCSTVSSDLKFQISNENQKPEDDSNFQPKTENRKLVFLAWRDVLQTYKIPQNLPLELICGVLQDVTVKRYETFEELYLYCYRVASTVGLMSSEILGYRDKAALEFAEALGIGMQLTNILRDLREDALMGRIYLPREDLRKFNVPEEQILAGVLSEDFIRLMKFQIARARRFYSAGERGIALLEKDSRLTVLLASRIYAKILDEIERQSYDVFSRRARTSKTGKIISFPRIWLESIRL